MREIWQCRIWNPHTESFEYSGGTPMMQSMFFRTTATLLTVDEQKYEYQTGLKDKNGKDIDWWEGDLFQHRVSDYPLILVQEDGAWWFKHDKARYQYYHIITCWTSPMPEIIGNIHENPDLRKG